jgi:Spy/CpxP family protein refolding chaperone
MKSTWIMPIGAAVVAAGLAFAYAETPSNSAPRDHAATRQQWMQRRFDRMSAYLNLTDTQKTQAQAVMKAAHENAMQFQAQLKQNRQALAAAVKTDNSGEIDRLSAVQGQLMGKTMAIRTEAFAKIYQTLTPEQRAKADQLQAHSRSMQHQRTQNRKQS